MSTKSPAASRSLRYTLITIKKRKDFQATSGGLRFSAPAFTLLRRVDRQAGQEKTSPAAPHHTKIENIEGALPYRFGFTVTKKLGNAVVRNRIRRRLKAAVSEAMGILPRLPSEERDTPAPVDFVILARIAALTHPFDALCADFSRAITRLRGGMDVSAPASKLRNPANAPRVNAALGKSPVYRLEGNVEE